MSKESEGLHGIFHYHPVLQAQESLKAGREIYKDELYIQIQIKGQKNQIRDRKATDEDKLDFPMAWAKFADQERATEIGTPISAIPGIGPSVMLEINQYGIHTVEDMANLPDSAMDKFRGATMFRQRAIAYLAAAEIMPEREESAEIEDPVNIEELKRTANVIPKTTKKRGRPPKLKVLQ